VTSLLQHVIDALSVGSTYALLALGLTLAYSIMNLINFGYGILLVWGAYGFLGFSEVGLPFALAVVLSIVGATLLTMVIGRVAFRPFINAPPITLLITSFAVLQIVQYAAILAWGEKPRIIPYPAAFSKVINIGALRIPLLEIITIGAAAVVVLIYFVILNRTALGAQVRAAAELPEMTKLVGIKPGTVQMTVFAISGAIAGVVGILWFAKSGAITPRSDLDPTLKAFIAIVLGGLGNTRGAIVGGFALGALEVLMSVVLPSGVLGYEQAIVFAIVIGILVLRPGGLAGAKVALT
jgi:branched-chain amino acid transport system permease protein